MDRVIFACVHSAGRSQMAAAFFNALADPARVASVSAGTRPAERVHPEAVAVMREAGFDLEVARPRLLTEDLARSATLLVTMGCGEECPVIPGLRREEWTLADPKGRSLPEVRKIRDEVRRHVEALVRRNGWMVGHDEHEEADGPLSVHSRRGSKPDGGGTSAAPRRR